MKRIDDYLEFENHAVKIKHIAYMQRLEGAKKTTIHVRMKERYQHNFSVGETIPEILKCISAFPHK